MFITMIYNLLLALFLHCPQNNLSPRIKTEPVTAGAPMVQKPDTYRCIYSNRDQLGLSVEFQIIFGTVHVVRM